MKKVISGVQLNNVFKELTYNSLSSAEKTRKCQCNVFLGYVLNRIKLLSIICQIPSNFPNEIHFSILHIKEAIGVPGKNPRHYVQT